MPTVRRAVSARLLAAAAVALAFVFPVAAAQPRDDTHEQFIVKFRDGTVEHGNAAARQRAFAAVGARLGLRIGPSRRMAVGADVIRVDRALDWPGAKALIGVLRADPSVQYVEIDRRVEHLYTPNDTLYPGQWGYFNPIAGMNAPTAWDYSIGSGEVIAVLDTGITPHGDLDANVVAGYDFIVNTATSADGDGRDADPTDPGDWVAFEQCGAGKPAKSSSWHGTHVAGIAAAVTNNAAGVAGTAWGAKIQPVRVLGKCGGWSSDISDAIVWASGGTVGGVPANATPADVINLSLGGAGSCAASTHAAIDVAVGNGTTVVVAAGNSNVDVAGVQPANCNNVIAVAALASNGKRASYSNYGSLIDIAAPGSSIQSTINLGTQASGAAGYGAMSGTSMAAPHVAGAVALLHAVEGGSPSYIEYMLKATTRAMAYPCPEGCGAGVLDAGFAVEAVAPPKVMLLAPDPAPEGNSGTHTMDFTVRINRPIELDVTATVATSDWTAQAGSDYVARTDTVTIPAGETTAIFAVTINGDTQQEPDEIFHAQIIGAGNATIITGQLEAVIVTDDYTELEDGVPVGLSGGEAEQQQFLLDVPAGARDVVISIAEWPGSGGDADLYVRYGAPADWNNHDCAPYRSDSNETCTFSPAQAGRYFVLIDTMVGFDSVELTGSYTLPVLSVGDVQVAEGNSGTKTVNFSVSLDGPALAPVTFDVATANGTAVAGSDYVAKALTGQTIAAGQSSKSFSVVVNGDTNVEGNEYLFANVANVVGADLADAQGTATILNDDGPTLSIADVAVAEGNAGTKALTFTVRLSQAAAGPVTYSIATSNGTATAGSDYVAKSLVGETIPAGQTTRTFSVVLNGDAAVEANETLRVDLAGATGATILDGQATGTILNDDGPTLSIANVAIGEGDAGTRTMTFTVRLSQAAPGPVTYDITTGNSTATAGSDYVASALSGQTIVAGKLARNFVVTINGDTTLEPNEVFKVTLSNASGATLLNGAATGTILNDEGSTLSINDRTVAEGQTNSHDMTFTVTLSKASASTVTYSIGASNGTTDGLLDFAASGGTYSLAPGQLSRTHYARSVADTTREPNEYFFVVLSNPTNATLFKASGRGTLLNDDGPYLRVNDVSVTEDDTGTKSMTFSVYLAKPTTVPISYDIATSNGTATAGSDYTAKSLVGETIAAGQQGKAFSVVINGDSTVEGNETIKVTLSNASGATLFDPVGVGTITNDD